MFTERADSKSVGPELLLESGVRGFNWDPVRSPCSVDRQVLPCPLSLRAEQKAGGWSRKEVFPGLKKLPDKHCGSQDLLKPGAEDGEGLRQPSYSLTKRHRCDINGPSHL